MSVKKCCENCNAEYNDYEYCPKCKYNEFNVSEYDFDLFTPNEEAVRKDERTKNIKEFIELAKGISTCFDSSLSEEEINAYCEGRENTKDYIVWYYEEKLKEM